MKQTQYTIRNVPHELDAKLRAKARREKQSLNSLLIEQLQRSVSKPKTNKLTNTDYDDLAGSWVKDPTFDEACRDLRRVDLKDWQ